MHGNASRSFGMMVHEEFFARDFTVEFPPRIWEVIKSFVVDYRHVWALQLRCRQTLETGHDGGIYALVTSDDFIITGS